MSINSLISTSANDCRITLEGELSSNPARAARIAIELLEQLQGMEGQASRRKVTAAILRKAAKALEVGS
ncbi:hypothetical protein [Halomonas lysinitropha]|uniref:Uncharacterized protein n=1 Tax=Halomonas lysinitropha TaxID=2607506 RepID=A0A5K1I7L4_9GAMM|nr:hypothetical protein [Halomonas lysinitropha]VVZ96461.1 hypothetical protein HALO32_02561 [Halomonas lysinitropha]